MKKPELLLFDLGGVLMRLNRPVDTFGLELSEAEFLKRWIKSPSVRDFERGLIDVASFAAAITREISVPYTIEEFLQRFTAWPDDFYPGALDLLDNIDEQYKKALMSNVSELHWQRGDIAGPLEGRFDKLYLSYLTGKIKPDADAFHHVLSDCDCNAGDVAFFDDNPTNVKAARDLGCQAFLTRGVDELRNALSQLDVKPGSNRD